MRPKGADLIFCGVIKMETKDTAGLVNNILHQCDKMSKVAIKNGELNFVRKVGKNLCKTYPILFKFILSIKIQTP